MREWRRGLLLAAVVLVVHGPCLRFGYTWLDDHKLVAESIPLLRDPAFALEAFRDDVFLSSIGSGFYRPLMTLSFMPAAILSGAAPFLHHATSLLVHLAGVLLAWGLLRAMIGGRTAPLLAALLFAVHPAIAQAVAWIPGRNDSLMAVFLLISFLAFLRHRRDGKVSTLAMHLVAWLLALLTKETAIVLPLACLGYLWIVEGVRPAAAPRLRVALAWIPVGLVFLAVRTAVVGWPRGFSGGTPLTSIVSSLKAFLITTGHVVLPSGLSVYPTVGPGVPWMGLIATAILATLVIGAKGEDRPRTLFGAAWYLLFLLPTVAKPTAGAERDVLDHRVYTSLVGALLVIPYARVRQAVPRRAAFTTAIVAIVIFSLVTLAYEQSFRDDRIFWRTAAATPNAWAFVLNNLGSSYFRQEKYAMAETAWRAAESRNPNERLVHANLGLLAERAGDVDTAAEEFRKELAVNPQDYAAHVKLGAIWYRRGRIDDAVALWAEARALRPRDAAAYEMLLRYCLESGDRDRAEALLSAARRFDVVLPPELVGAVRAAGL